LSIGGSGRPDPQERALYRALAKAGVTRGRGDGQ
jgi:hypothetical protein